MGYVSSSASGGLPRRSSFFLVKQPINVKLTSDSPVISPHLIHPTPLPMRSVLLVALLIGSAAAADKVNGEHHISLSPLPLFPRSPSCRGGGLKICARWCSPSSPFSPSYFTCLPRQQSWPAPRPSDPGGARTSSPTAGMLFEMFPTQLYQ
jgi:hypothetical protein